MAIDDSEGCAEGLGGGSVCAGGPLTDYPLIGQSGVMLFWLKTKSTRDKQI